MMRIVWVEILNVSCALGETLYRSSRVEETIGFIT